MGELEGKAAIVTGSGRGIGRAIALAFAKEGASVVVNVSRSVDQMNEVVNEIRSFGGKAIGVVADVSKYSEAGKLVNEAIKSFGKVDILVNNAGIARPAMSYKITEEEWSSVINVNLTGTMNCIRAVAPHMIERKYGRIINISSVTGETGLIGNISYAASKAGMLAITKTAAKELARYGILVNAVCPGFIETAMTEWLKEPKFAEKWLPRIPLGRLGKPEEVASLVVFLASDKCSYMTGSVIYIDGGLTLL
ncbi:MAG: 3-oxoacyl-ACP reductase family protein [Candidatus Bathyarchaeia archaeon]